MTTLLRSLLAGSSLLCCTPALADVVADWNAIALNAVESSGAQPATALRALAGVHVAMFEAMNFIERRYVPRLVVRPVSPIAASSEAAAAASAHLVLTRLYPGQSAALDAALERSLAEIPDGGEKASGTVTGRAIGGNVYAVWNWNEAPARSPVAAAEPAAEPLLWNLIAAKLIEGKPLAPIEAARTHALVSMAVSELYCAAGRGSRALHADHLCVHCAAGVATLKVVASALAPERSRSASADKFGTPEASGWVRVIEQADKPSLRKLDDATILRAMLTYSERSAGPPERRVGEGFGAQALAHYRPAN
jgi:hypothetical protein